VPLSPRLGRALVWDRALALRRPARIRLRYLDFAKLWHEMTREAERKANCSSSSDDKAVVIFPMQFQKRSSAPSEQT
jgi:hypothetical protein